MTTSFDQEAQRFSAATTALVRASENIVKMEESIQEMKELKSTASSINSRMASVEEQLKTMSDDTAKECAVASTKGVETLVVAMNGRMSNLENKVDILTDKTTELTELIANLSKDISDQGARTNNDEVTINKSTTSLVNSRQAAPDILKLLQANGPIGSPSIAPKDIIHGRKEEVENNLKILLRQNGGCMRLDNVKERYRAQFGYSIPSELYGHSSLKDWLQTLDFLSLTQPHGKRFQWFVILSEKSRKESSDEKLVEALLPYLKTLDADVVRGILKTT